MNRGFFLKPNETMKLTLDFNGEKSIIRKGSNQDKLKMVIAVIFYPEAEMVKRAGLHTLWR